MAWLDSIFNQPGAYTSRTALRLAPAPAYPVMAATRDSDQSLWCWAPGAAGSDDDATVLVPSAPSDAAKGRWILFLPQGSGSGSGSGTGGGTVDGIPAVANVAALRAKSATTGVVYLECYSTLGDGGGGFFYYSHAVLYDNGGTVFNYGGLGSDSAGWRRIYSDTVDYAWWGGSRSTKNTLDAAMSALSYGGKIRVGSAVTLSTSETITPEYTLQFDGGGQIAIDNGVSLTIAGSVDATPQKIFALDSGGTVSFTGDCDVDVRWFGAVGNGATDDTAAIQAAIDSATNKTVRLPAATYLVGSSGTGLTLTASDANPRILIGCGATLLCTYAGVIDVLTVSTSDCVISDLTIACTASAYNQSLLYLHNASHCSVRNLICTHVGPNNAARGIKIDGTSSYNQIVNYTYDSSSPVSGSYGLYVYGSKALYNSVLGGSISGAYVGVHDELCIGTGLVGVALVNNTTTFTLATSHYFKAESCESVTPTGGVHATIDSSSNCAMFAHNRFADPMASISSILDSGVGTIWITTSDDAVPTSLQYQSTVRLGTYAEDLNVTTGTAVPTASATDGSLYLRSGSPHGGAYVRSGGTWVELSTNDTNGVATTLSEGYLAPTSLEPAGSVYLRRSPTDWQTSLYLTPGGGAWYGVVATEVPGSTSYTLYNSAGHGAAWTPVLTVDGSVATTTRVAIDDAKLKLSFGGSTGTVVARELVGITQYGALYIGLGSTAESATNCALASNGTSVLVNAPTASTGHIELDLGGNPVGYYDANGYGLITATGQSPPASAPTGSWSRHYVSGGELTCPARTGSEVKYDQMGAHWAVAQRNNGVASGATFQILLGTITVPYDTSVHWPYIFGTVRVLAMAGGGSYNSVPYVDAYVSVSAGSCRPSATDYAVGITKITDNGGTYTLSAVGLTVCGVVPGPAGTISGSDRKVYLGVTSPLGGTCDFAVYADMHSIW